MPAGITLERAIKAFATELGCSGDGEEIDREYFIDKVWAGLEFLLFNGGGKILREWKIVGKNNIFTLPRDLETPIKYKLSPLPSADYGVFSTPYYSYSSNALKTFNGYRDFDKNLALHANYTPVQFQPPKCGVRLVATTRNKKDVGRKIMVNGKQRGKELPTVHNGIKTSGELLTIYAEDDPNKKYSAFQFDEITGVVKEELHDWMMLSGIDGNNIFHFLSHYHPDETVPLYTQAQMFTNPQTLGNTPVLMHVLGRINPSIRYTRDEDILPITAITILEYLAKRAYYDSKGEFNNVAVMEQRIRNAINTQLKYQSPPGSGMSISLTGSATTVSNV